MIHLASTTPIRRSPRRDIADEHFINALDFSFRTAPDIAREMLRAGRPASVAAIRERMAEFCRESPEIEARCDSWRIAPANDRALGLGLHHGDCLELMRAIPDRSIDLILADLPYGVTCCSWDKRIDLDAFWREARRVLTPLGNVLMFSAQPFTTDLIQSNREWFKYAAVWKKSKPTGFQHSKSRPMSIHEDVLVFSPAVLVKHSKRRVVYNPQGLIELEKQHVRRGGQRSILLGKSILKQSIQTHTNYPTTVMEFPSVGQKGRLHTSQKPVDLLAYLIRTHSPEGSTVLDPTCGSGSTAIAAMETDRRWIAIEKDREIYEGARLRIEARS